MVVQQKARARTTEKDNGKDIAKSITDMLWDYNEIKRTVNNNYVVLQSVVRNVVKSLGINTDNFDIESFNDNFDIHELDLESQDTLADSLSKLLSRFIVNKADNNIDKAIEMAPYEITNRLNEIMAYLKTNPKDNETVDYAKELIAGLKEFNRELARKYEIELSTILNPKPVEPRAKVRVIESKPVEPKPMVIERPKPEPKPVVKHNVVNDRAKEIENTEYFLKMYIAYIRLPQSQSTPYFIEKAKELIDRLRKLDPQKANKYERILNTVLYEKRKYAKEPRAKVRIRYASAKITEYFNTNESESESDKREWKRYVKGILKWIMIIGMI
jgi:hypothetical protein